MASKSIAELLLLRSNEVINRGTINSSGISGLKPWINILLLISIYILILMPVESVAATPSLKRLSSPSVVNLTSSPGDEMSPQWSPDGRFIAFTSDAIDANTDGKLDTVVMDKRYLYIIKPDGTGLKQYILTAGKVQAFLWSTVTIDHNVSEPAYGLFAIVNTGTDYDQKNSLNYYVQATSTIHRVWPSDEIIEQTQPINSACISIDGRSIFFDMLTTTNTWDIYKLSIVWTGNVPNLTIDLTGGNVPNPTRLTAATTGEYYKNPSIANSGNEILFDYTNLSNDSLDTRTHIWKMSPGGTLKKQITNGNGDDTEPKYTQDGKLLFTSNRSTASGDVTNNKNIWIMKYGEEGTGDPAITPEPRYFNDLLNFDNYNKVPNQYSSNPQPGLGNPGDIIFISDRNENTHDLFISVLTDIQTPYVSSSPVITPREATPGSIMNISVRIASYNSVRHVWMQIKDPDTDTTDKEGIDHVITLDDATLGETSPLDFGPYDIISGSYLDIHNGSNGYPGYYTQTSNPRLFAGSNDGDGYPEVPTHWIELKDNGLLNNGDDVANDGIFSVKWQAPMEDSDWYIDIIVEDTVNLLQDGNNNWHGNRKRYDNISGFSTSPFTGGHSILFVDDYIDGQKFMSSGVTGAVTQYDPILYTNSPYYSRIDSPLAVNRADSTATFNFTPGADIWRVLCRGRIPDTTLNSYLPDERIYVSPLDGSTQISSSGHGSKIVVWASPFPASRMMVNSGDGNGTGSIIEKRTQDTLKNFVQSGGRLLLMGSDLVQDLTQNGVTPNSFLSEVAGLKSSSAFTVIPSGPDAITTVTNWYGSTLASPTISGGAAIVRNNNLSQYTLASPISVDLCWDPCLVTNGGKGAMILTSANSQGMTRAASTYLAISREDSTKNGRVITFTFNPDNIVSTDRYKLLNDSFEWLFDGAVQGVVMQQNEGNSPLGNILVTVSESTKVTITNSDGTTSDKYSKAKDIYSVKTDSSGNYYFGGLRPGKIYGVTVSPNGYLGSTQVFTPALKGGAIYKGADVNFRLLRNPDKASVYGTVLTSDGLTLAGAEVKATPLSNGNPVTVKSNNAGIYSIDNIEVGAYLITATNLNDGLSVTEFVTLDGVPGNALTLRLGTYLANPGELTGIVLGGNTPLRGVTVTATMNGISYDTETDYNGKFKYIGLFSDGNISIKTSPQGYIGDTREVTGYIALLGKFVDPIVLSSTSQTSTDSTAIQGKIYDGISGKALAGAKVTFFINGLTYKTILSTNIFTGDNGGYNYKVSVPAGIYKLRYEMQGRKTIDEMIVTVTTNEIKIINVNLMSFYTITSGINMFSMPGDFSGIAMSTIFGLSNSDAVLLDDKIATDYNNYNSSYNKFSSSNPYTIIPGKGYWSNFTTSKSVNLTGPSVDSTTPYAIPLNAGWTLIGNPFPYSVSLTSSSIDINGAIKTWNQAVTDVNVSSSVYGWIIDPWSGKGSYSSATIIDAYKGYWIYCYQNCTLNLSNVQVRSASVRQSVDGWISSVIVNANNGEISKNYYGAVKDASDSFDNRFDSRTPPQSPAVKLRSGFVHTDWGNVNGSYISDVRKTSTGDWKLQIDAVNPGSAVILNWSSLSKDLPGGYEVNLTDEENGKIISMNTVNQYQYIQDLYKNTSRTFKISVSKRSALLQIYNIRCSNKRTQAISFDSSVSGNASIVIRSVTGSRLLSGNIDVISGENIWNWSSIDQSGKILQLGNYICEVKLSDLTGRSVRAVGYVSLIGR